MARIALSNVVNEQFVNRFVGLASGATDSTSRLQNALSGGATTTDLSSALRTGANVYASAVQGFNIGLTFLNFTRNTLSSLREIGEELVTILEQASSGSVGSQGLASFQRKFEELGEQFQDLLESGEIGDRQYLSREGLEELFVTLGIDPDKSVEIADIFDTFILADSEDKIKGEDVFALASERIRAPRPVRLQGNVFGKTEATTEFTLSTPTAITNSAPTTGQLSDVNSVVQVNDPNGSGFQSIEQTSVGPVQGGLVPALTSDVTLHAVNEATGYSLIESTEDFLGQNGSNFSQLFLADEVGNIVHQVTTFSQSLTITDADIAADDLSFAFGFDLGGGGFASVHKVTLSSTSDYGVSAGGTVSVIETQLSSSGNYTDVKISDNGQYVASVDSNGQASLRDGTTADTGAISLIADGASLAFLADNTVAVARTGGNTIEYAAFGAGSTTALASNVDTTVDISAVQSGSGFVSYYNSTSSEVRLIDTSLTDVTVSTTHNTANLQLSLAVNSTAGIDVGLYGNTGIDSDLELYRYNVNGTTVTGGSSVTPQSGDDLNAGFISTANNVFTDTDDTDHLNYNSGNVSLLTLSTGSITTSIPDTLTANVTLLDVNQKTGVSLVQTSQDLLGHGNTGNDLFLLDAAGRAVKQIASSASLVDAKIASDTNEVFLLEQFGPVAQINRATVSSFDGGNITSLTTNFSRVDTLTTIEVSDDGQRYATANSNSIFVGVNGIGVTGSIFTGFSPVFDFIDDRQLAVVKTDGQTQDIVQVDVDDAIVGTTTEQVLIHGLNNVTDLSASQDGGGANQEAILTFNEAGITKVSSYLVDVDTTSTVTKRGEFLYDGTQETSLKVSAQRSADSTFALGLFGDLSATSGDADNELYQLDLQSQVVPAGQQFSNIIRDFETIFSDERDLRRRPEAAVLLADIEELLEQIDDNIDVVDNLSEILADTLTVIRATGTAMLDLSEQITGAEDARDVAQDLQQRIQRQGGSAVFAHGGRLLDVATAALTLNEDTFGDFSDIL